MIYKNEALREISFPLGGIGTGSIGLSGTGHLVDWEIYNRPAKGSTNYFTHFAVRATDSKGNRKTYILNGDVTKELTGRYKRQNQYTGFGYGPDSQSMVGFPHFRDVTFKGEFPMAEIRFSDEDFPADVVMTAFNPMIPNDSKNSSIPVALFNIRIENKTEEAYTYYVVFSCGNPFFNGVNQETSNENYTMVTLYSSDEKTETTYSDLTVAVRAADADVQPYWYRGDWSDGIVSFWNELNEKEHLSKRIYSEPFNRPSKRDMASVAVTVSAAARGAVETDWCLTWNTPNNYNYWSTAPCPNNKWKNWYATQWEDSAASAVYALENLDMLTQRTKTFHDILFDTTVDDTILDAVSATMSVLKTATVLRLENGEFYGWEGCMETVGSCEGTCQHVWNYAYALCFLFPDLERSIRDLEFRYTVGKQGDMNFRLRLPLNSQNANTGESEQVKFYPCLDGQMGAVMKTYREWKICGNDTWLKSHWQTLKKVIAFAWHPESKWEWDKNKDGVLEGRQHHTLDMELFGPSSWLQGFYSGALRAMAEMAEYLGDEDAAMYRDLSEKGIAWTKENLFNGKYFIQKVDIRDKTPVDHFNCPQYWNEETNQIKYQIGEGSSIDQLCGQWHADLIGLGDLFDPAQVDTALQNLYKNNYKTTMRNFVNPWRIFCLNDEAGAVICDYPAGAEKPAIPVPYCEESMHGFEYQMAGILMSRGYYDEGLQVVKSVRDRYAGHNRNPWNEIECGSNYARSMASFALLPILSGFTFDMPHQTIGFNPKREGDFRILFSLDGAWGQFRKTATTAEIYLQEGKLMLRAVKLPFMREPQSLRINGKTVPFTFADGTLTFEATETVNLTVTY